MDLDNLKAAWQKDTGIQPGLDQTEMERVQSILRGKALDMIETLKRKYEKIITAMLTGMLLLGIVFPLLSDGFSYPGSASGFAKAMFFYLILILFYWSKLRAVNNLDLSDHIQERLSQMLALLNRNKKIESIFTLLFLVFFLLVGRFFYGRGLTGILKPEVAGGAVIAVLFTFAMVCLIRKRYQAQIIELRGYLAEYEKAE